MVSRVQPVWAGQEFRLDPMRLPQQVSYAPRDGNEAVTITVNANGATLKRKLERSGLPLNIALPSRAFRGVAARALELGPDTAMVTLELLHEDEGLCVPLRVGHDLAAIARDWQLWAEVLKLPMMIVDADGIARDLDDSARAAIVAGPSHERRANAFFAQRRPRFLARRRLGHLGCRLVVEGREFIARDDR